MNSLSQSARKLAAGTRDLFLRGKHFGLVLFILWAVATITLFALLPRIYDRAWVRRSDDVLERNRGHQTLQRMTALKNLIQQYWYGKGLLPGTENTEIASALSHSNRVNRKGELIDAYGRPFVFAYATNRYGIWVRIRSYGRNGDDDRGKYDDLKYDFLLETEQIGRGRKKLSDGRY